MSRVDGILKVTGKATYAAEHELAGTVYAVIAGSTIARGKVTTVHTEQARALDGVLDVLTDFGAVKFAYDSTKVNFFGQPIAVVLATSIEQAEHGASLISAGYTTEPIVPDMHTPGAPEEPDPETPDQQRGDAEAALRSAHTTVDLTFDMSRQHHNPIETQSTIAGWNGGKLTLYDKTQSAPSTAKAVAAAFGMKPADVRVISPFVGGAFGNAIRIREHQVLAALAARVLGRPVKLVLSRKQMYPGTGYRPMSRQRFRIGSGADGRIIAISQQAWHETARYERYSDGLTALTGFLYTSPNMLATQRLVRVDLTTPTSMRGPGASSNAFALESAIDELAHRCGLDPIELRMRNEPKDDQTTGQPFTSRRLLDCYRLGARRFGWSRRSQRPRSLRDGELLIGMGMAAAAFFAGGLPSSALARIHADGSADVLSATADIGPGTYTSMTQVAADALGLPMDKVRFSLGDSAMPPAVFQAGSLTMASVGSAVFTSCATLRDGFVRTAVVDPRSPLHGVTPAEVSVWDGRLFVTADPGRGETYQQILLRRGKPSMDNQENWTPKDSTASGYSYGAVFAEVSVDESLGQVRIRKMFGAYDIGRVISPKLAHSQAIGGMVGGIGACLLEAGTVDHRDGRTVNANLADYLVPVNADVPELDAAFVDSTDSEVGAIGAKGMGEVVIVGVAAAIANAVFNATGKRVTGLPITLDKLL